MAAEIMTTLKMKVVEVLGIRLMGAEMNTKKVEYKIKDELFLISVIITPQFISSFKHLLNFYHSESTESPDGNPANINDTCQSSSGGKFKLY